MVTTPAPAPTPPGKRRSITAPKLHRDESRSAVAAALKLPKETASDIAMHSHLIGNGFIFHDCSNQEVVFFMDDLPTPAVGIGKAEWLGKVDGAALPTLNKAITGLYVKNTDFDFKGYAEAHARMTGGAAQRGPVLTGHAIGDLIAMDNYLEKQRKGVEQANARFNQAVEQRKGYLVTADALVKANKTTIAEAKVAYLEAEQKAVDEKAAAPAPETAPVS